MSIAIGLGLFVALPVGWFVVLPRVFERYLADTAWQTRVATANVLAWAPVPGGTRLLTEALAREVESSNVASACIHALVIRDPVAAEPILLRIMEDRTEDGHSRYAALKGLCEIGGPLSIDPLIRLLTDSTIDSWGFRPLPSDRVVMALTRITQRDFGKDAAAWRTWRAAEAKAKER